MIRGINIYKKYDKVEVLKGVNLEVQPAEIVSIVGASGAGKTTLLHILSTLETANSGEIWLKDQKIQALKGKKLATFRNQMIGFVFQFHNLLPEFTALENTMMPALLANISTKVAENRAFELLQILGLEHRLKHFPSELSGGEQQRVAIARALVNNPAVIFADEPSGNLDSQNAKELHKLFFNLRDNFKQTFVIVTHNPELAQMADRKLTMQDGIIV